MSLRLPCLLAVFSLAGCIAAPTERSAPAEIDEEATNALSLSAMLIRDGHYDRAGATLAGIDPQAAGLDRGRLFTLRGLVALHDERYAPARDDLRRAEQEGGVDPMVSVYLAQAEFALREFDGAVATLDRSRAAWDLMPRVHSMFARAHWARGDHEGALTALSRADGRFPEDPGFSKQRVLYLLELGLFVEAAEAGGDYLRRAGGTAAAYLTLGEAMRRSRKPLDAARVLEDARLRYPADTKLMVALAHAYLDAEQPRAAAQVMERAAIYDDAYSTEAAELYRRAGAADRALYLNMQACDQEAKARQRLGLLLELGRHTQASALDPRLARLGLLEEEDVRYALAYSHYRAGDLTLATERLRGITRSDLFRAATALRKAIDAERLAQGIK